MIIENISASERQNLLEVAVSTGLFEFDEADALLGEVIDGLVSGAMPVGHEAVCCRTSAGEPVSGWAYFAPDQHASGIWNLWWIGVRPEDHGTGAGSRLIRYVEATIASRGGRVVVVETSASDVLQRARAFYERQGYTECGRVPDFYSEGEAKVIFARRPRVA